jgi:hypothetical protein
LTTSDAAVDLHLVEVGVTTALVGGVLAFAIGYTIHRTRRRAGAASI